MTQTFDVIATCEIHCDGWHREPRYRLYVDSELFAERTWIWRDLHLEEVLTVRGQAGRYRVKLENVDPELGMFKLRNLKITAGPGVIANDGSIQIYVPETANDTE